MCLSSVTGAPKGEKGFGYKVMRHVTRSNRLRIVSGIYAQRNGLYNVNYHDLEEKGEIVPYQKRVWYDADPGGKTITYSWDSEPRPTYQRGFHVYTKKPSRSRYGRRYVTVRVEYDGAHTAGLQGGDRVIVARYMRIMEVLK